MQIQHETIESIYTHDPNGYMVEITRALRPVTPQEDLDAELTIDALIDMASRPDPSMDDPADPQGRAHRRARRACGSGARRAGRARRVGEGRGNGRTRASAGRTGKVMTSRLFMLDVPENVPIVGVARDLPGVNVGKIGPYFEIESEAPVSIDRRATGVRHAVWYSCLAGLDGWRIAQ